MTAAQAHGTHDAATALDEQLARSLRLVLPVVAAIYGLSRLAVASGLTRPSTDAAAAATFLALGLLIIVRPVPSRLANPILVGGSAVVTLEALMHGEAAAANLALALLGAGAVALRPRWALASAAAILGPWLLAACLGWWGWRLDDHVPSELAAAAALAAVIFEARHGSIAGLVAARGALHALALTDPLTGLLNRRGIEEEAARMFGPGVPQLSIVFLDLDGFKAVNDSLGHAEGDRALQAMAEILLETFRAADAVARIGGDEFLVVVAPGSDVAQAAGRLERYLAAWRDAGNRYSLRASIGTGCLNSATREGFWEAVDAADRRMYAQKQARRAAGLSAAEAPAASAPGLVPALS
jgi:diguanylate cyclase (GGDEF)-like protein